MAGALDDAGPGDDPLGRHRVGRCDPLDPGNKNERNRQEEDGDPNGRDRPVARVLRNVERTNSRRDNEDRLHDDRGKQGLNVRVHVPDDDLVLAEELFRQSHDTIMPDRRNL